MTIYRGRCRGELHVDGEFYRLHPDHVYYWREGPLAQDARCPACKRPLEIVASPSTRVPSVDALRQLALQLRSDRESSALVSVAAHFVQTVEDALLTMEAYFDDAEKRDFMLHGHEDADPTFLDLISECEMEIADRTDDEGRFGRGEACAFVIQLVARWLRERIES